MSRVLALFSSLVILVSTVVADLPEALRHTLPQGVTLGMSVSSLKEARPDAQEGPVASLPAAEASGSRVKYPTFMEVRDFGTPASTTYWYLTDDDQIVGCLRTRHLLQVEKEQAQRIAAESFAIMARAFGRPTADVAMRKGDRGFVSVSVDRWDVPELQGAAYLIATNKEVTTALTKKSSFPLGQIFIKPNGTQTPLEPEDQRSIANLERPSFESVAATGDSRAQQRPEPPEQSGKTAQTKSTASEEQPTEENKTYWGIVGVVAALLMALIGFKILGGKRNGNVR